MVYGTWRIVSDRPAPQEVNRRVQACLELGITTIDTAEIYGLYEVERALGEALALSPGLRDKLEIVTKAGIYVPCKGQPDRRTAHYDASGPRMVESLEKSLRLLGTDRVELPSSIGLMGAPLPTTRPAVSINCCGKARSGPRACRTTSLRSSICSIATWIIRWRPTRSSSTSCTWTRSTMAR